MNMHIAQTILEQLGGNRFAVMTGAKNFGASADALSFALPANFAKNGINRVRVTLTPADVYTVEFFKVRGTSIKHLGTHEGIYADMLRDLFTRETGLDVSL